MKLSLFATVISALAAVSWSGGLTAHLAAQSLGGGSTSGSSSLKENLDLPYDAVGDGSSEEEAPEVIVFYGQQYEGDAFFYTVDKSGSMQDRGELPRAKAEISRNISEFSERTEFAVNFFDSNIYKFPANGRPTLANPAMKAAALSWVAGQPGGNGSCCQKGFVAALQAANLSTARRRVIVYVGDGGGTCAGDEDSYLRQCLALVVSQNYNHAQVNTIGVLMDANRVRQEDFLKAMAAANGGTYKRI
jgi:hypothetical protein